MDSSKDVMVSGIYVFAHDKKDLYIYKLEHNNLQGEADSDHEAYNHQGDYEGDLDHK
jgi:hypothetical protein